MRIFVLVLMGWALMTLVSAVAAQGATGASAAFTSKDSVVGKAMSLVKEGNLNGAEVVLKDEKAQDSRAVEEALEIIQRIRREYSLDAFELLTKLRKSIPDATAADVQKWTKSGELGY